MNNKYSLYLTTFIGLTINISLLFFFVYTNGVYKKYLPDSLQLKATNKNLTTIPEKSLENTNQSELKINNKSKKIKRNINKISHKTTNSIEVKRIFIKKVAIEWGDTLEKIASLQYGNTKYWPYLYFDNADRITDPDKLIPILHDLKVYNHQPDDLAELYVRLYKKYKTENKTGLALKMLESARSHDNKYLDEHKKDIFKDDLVRIQ